MHGAFIISAVEQECRLYSGC